MTTGELADADDLELLVDVGAVVVHDKRDFQDVSPEFRDADDQGRVILKRVTYRITDKGFELIEPWFRRWPRNVLSNLPTFISSVILAVVIAVVIDRLGL